MIHLSEAIVGVNKKPQQVGCLKFTNLKKGDTIYASFWWTSEKNFAHDEEYTDLVFDKILAPNKYQFLYKGSQRPHVIDLNGRNEEVIDGGLDQGYLVVKNDNFGIIRAYSFSLDTLRKLVKKYFI